ncbi:MAG: HNH endonuclease [Candidatus Poribacteria bacterium]|nr:HNH endonuclease [Candidatus Poribacteria bacterium]
MWCSRIGRWATLTVDHYHPTIHGGTNDDENLVYCCPRCNEHKGAYWHEVQIPHLRLLHPLEDNLTLHLREQQNAELIGETPEGAFYIQRLRLNRPQLIEHRRRKHADQKRMKSRCCVNRYPIYNKS